MGTAACLVRPVLWCRELSAVKALATDVLVQRSRQGLGYAAPFGGSRSCLYAYRYFNSLQLEAFLARVVSKSSC
jgi:hypothetical protein